MLKSSRSVIVPPNREVENVPTDSQENRARGVKIQVGSYSSSSTSKQPDIAKSKEALAVAASAATAKAAASVTSSTTLYDLCDSSYNLKYCKRERKKKESITAEEKALAEVRNKNAILENARSNSSSSSKNQRMKEQCGMGPRVEIVNGKIIVRESSLVVSQDSNFADGEYEEVVEGNHATATYSSFLKSRHSFSWGIEETRLFYQCLRQCGTEFSIMQSFFPGRTRKQLRAKFFREEKQHPELVKIALSTSLPLEIIPFEPSLTGKATVPTTALPTAEVTSETLISLSEGQDGESESSRVEKRSAQSAALSSSPDSKKRSTSNQDANRREATAPVHIELISDDDDVLYDV